MKCDDLRGRVAVVTGGARGIGYSLAQALAGQGCSVALLDLLPEVEASAARLAEQTGAPTAHATVDVTDPDSVDAAFETVARALGTPEILVTAAGICIWGDSTEVDRATWSRVVDVNLSGTFYCAQAFGRRAIGAGVRGSIVMISSMSARIVNVPQFQASYNASKAGVDHLVKSLAVEWAQRGIRVNAIAPGYTLSNMTRQFTEVEPELAAQWNAATPMGRMGTPEDLHGPTLLLASDAAAGYLTGQTIVVDGGYTAI
ncbi:SDR family oxidoreductase [Leucobacter sp. CSA1]|uniref:SDR family oxidoreductase n=1 Tax=Leucobacter chromiisoli TaxID=2796471 RepID=A0A934UTM8_9MICO|nr:SDR family oxidoreductase [Leucobacter chromiisoli]MBK0417531.1 SDR family oxidoreductase [Leucobacter chromiisoli]